MVTGQPLSRPCIPPPAPAPGLPPLPSAPRDMAPPIPRPGGLHLGPDFGNLAHPGRPGPPPPPRRRPTASAPSPPRTPPPHPGVAPPGLPRLAKIADSAPNYNSVMQPAIKYGETVQPHQAPMPTMNDQCSSNATPCGDRTAALSVFGRCSVSHHLDSLQVIASRRQPARNPFRHKFGNRHRHQENLPESSTYARANLDC